MTTDLSRGDAAAREIARRFAWAAARGHPQYPWPEVPVPAWRAGLAEIERVTRLILTDRGPVRLHGKRIGARALGVAGYTSGMGALLGFWLETGVLAADRDAAAVLQRHLEHGRRRADRVGRGLNHVLDILADVGIAPTVIKGAHTGRAYFPEPGTRPAADIDLVIARADRERARRALGAAGYRATTRQARPYKCDWVAPDAPRQLHSLEVDHEENPWALEIHESLERNVFGVATVRFGPADAGVTEPWPEATRPARVLAQPLLFAFLAVHASEELHHLRLVRLVELILVSRRDTAVGRLDWTAVSALLTATNGRRFAYPAVELAERLVPGSMDPGLRAALAAAATPRMRRVVGRLEPGTAQRLERLSLEERFMWAHGPVEIARRAVHSLWPTRDGTVADALRTYATRFRRLVRGTVTWRSGGPPAA